MHRRRPAADPERRAALLGAQTELRTAWTDEHHRYVRRGPQIIGRTNDPVCRLGRELRIEHARLRSMLNPTSGTPPPEPKVVTAKQMYGHIGHLRSASARIAGEHGTIMEVLGAGKIVARKGGGSYPMMRELNEEAQRLLGDLNDERQALKVAHARYMLHAPLGTYEQNDEWDKVENLVTAARQEADQLAAELRQSARRRTPIKRAGRAKWPADRIEWSLSNFKATEGRWPTAAELRTNPNLPHYTQLQRLYGPRFIGRLDTLVSNVTSP